MIHVDSILAPYRGWFARKESSDGGTYVIIYSMYLFY